MPFLLLLAFIFNSKGLTECIIKAMIFCFNKLIPSIFPSMILTSIIAQLLSKISLNKNSKKLLGMEKRLLSIALPSWISGFLIGPKLLCKSKSFSNQTNNVILTTNAGVGFVISLVGITLWNNIGFGIYLYAVQIMTSIAIYNILKKREPIPLDIDFEQKPFLTIISNSISQCTHTMLDICGFTIFFSSIKFSLCSLFRINNKSIIYYIISAILEISDGVLTSSSISNNFVASFLTGFCIGFGGICIITQTISICQSHINIIKFFCAKFFQGIICGAFSLLYVMLFNINPKEIISTSITYETSIISVLINCLFVFLMFNYTKKSILKLI